MEKAWIGWIIGRCMRKLLRRVGRGLDKGEMDKEDTEVGWIKERWIRKTGRWAG